MATDTNLATQAADSRPKVTAASASPRAAGPSGAGQLADKLLIDVSYDV
jgi:hypothetical protein